MSKAKDFYWSDEMVRTTEEIQECSLQTSGDKFGCIHPPLIRIPPCNVVPDELHLMLRITGIIIINCTVFSFFHWLKAYK